MFIGMYMHVHTMLHMHVYLYTVCVCCIHTRVYVPVGGVKERLKWADGKLVRTLVEQEVHTHNTRTHAHQSL